VTQILVNMSYWLGQLNIRQIIVSSKYTQYYVPDNDYSFRILVITCLKFICHSQFLLGLFYVYRKLNRI